MCDTRAKNTRLRSTTGINGRATASLGQAQLVLANTQAFAQIDKRLPSLLVPWFGQHHVGILRLFASDLLSVLVIDKADMMRHLF